MKKKIKILEESNITREIMFKYMIDTLSRQFGKDIKGIKFYEDKDKKTLIKMEIIFDNEDRKKGGLNER